MASSVAGVIGVAEVPNIMAIVAMSRAITTTLSINQMTNCKSLLMKIAMVVDQ